MNIKKVTMKTLLFRTNKEKVRVWEPVSWKCLNAYPRKFQFYSEASSIELVRHSVFINEFIFAFTSVVVKLNLGYCSFKQNIL